jgi:glycerol kinase
VRPRTFETTALGAAFAAGLKAGLWPGRERLRDIWQADAIYEPSMDAVTRGALVERWTAAVRAARSFGGRA